MKEYVTISKFETDPTEGLFFIDSATIDSAAGEGFEVVLGVMADAYHAGADPEIGE